MMILILHFVFIFYSNKQPELSRKIMLFDMILK